LMQLGGVPSTNRVASQNYHTARGPRKFVGARTLLLVLAPTTNFVHPQISLGRVRYDNFVMQHGWCLAHRLESAKILDCTVTRRWHVFGQRLDQPPSDQQRRAPHTQCSPRLRTAARPWTTDCTPQATDRRPQTWTSDLDRIDRPFILLPDC